MTTKFIATFLSSLCCVGMEAATDTLSLNRGWMFKAGEGQYATLTAAVAKTQGWREVNVPHDFQIEQPWVAPDANEKADNSDAGANIKSRLSARGFKEMGGGWYVKTIVPDAKNKGKRALLNFEGIMYYGDVYLNGERIGGTDYGYVGFELDVTRKLKYGEENTIAVYANTANAKASRWYTGGGRFRDVPLI